MAQPVLFSYPTIGAGSGGTAPSVIDDTFNITDAYINDQAVGTVTFTGDPSPTLSITAGNTNTAFAINSSTGVITVADATQLDNATTPSYSLTVSGTNTEGTDTCTITVNVADASAETLLETVTLSNFSGASRTDPIITFRRSFESGAVPSGSHVEMRYSDTAITVQQYDGEKTHSDGSLAHATFTAKVEAGAVADNATIDVALYKVAGAKDNGTALAWTTVTGRDYRIKMVISGTSYYAVLNNLFTAGTYRDLRSGQACVARKAWGVFRAGTGASDTDQGQLQAAFYIYYFVNGRVAIFPEAINGRLANGEAYTVDSLTLENGTTALVEHTTDFTFAGHSGVAAVGADAQPYWDNAGTQELTDFWAHVSPTYLHDKKLLWNIETTPTMVSAIGSGTAIDYAPMTLGSIGSSSVDSAGGNNWIGLVPLWTFQALLSNDKTRLRNDRVNALSQYTKHRGWYRSHVTGFPPVLINEDYTADGLSAAQTSIGWGSGATITDTGDAPAGSVGNASHCPEYCYAQYVTTGWEWWLDHHMHLIVGILGDHNPGTAYYQRNAILNSTQFYGTYVTAPQARARAWWLRSLSNGAFVQPDDYPTVNYVNDMVTNELAVLTQQFTAPDYTSTLEALGIYLTLEGTAEDVAHAAWMHDFITMNFCQMINRGQATTSHLLVTKHITKWVVGRGVDGCAYHALGADRIAIRTGSAPTTGDPYAEDWDDVYYGGDGFGLQTTKLVSDSGGASGTCPASGNATTYTTNSYPSIAHAMTHCAAMVGITGATTIQAKMDAVETAASISESDWAAFPSWRVRGPA